MSKLVKKILVSIFASLVLLMSVAPAINVKAADTWYSSGFPAWYSKVYGGDQTEIFGERYTAAQVQWVFYGFWSMVINAFLNAANCDSSKVANWLSGNLNGSPCSLGYNSTVKDKAVASSPGQNFLSILFADRPLSGITYVKDLGRKFNIIPEAKAQTVGFGYQALQPVQQLWQATRNVSYGLFIIVLLVLAFMIMFRVKIAPQVVVTVQSALPKIAIALVVVTFSYAIAGFLIDLMYVFIGIISLVFASTKLVYPSDPVSLFGFFTTGPSTGIITNTGIWGFLLLYLIQFATTFFVVGIGLGYGLLSGLGNAAGTVGAVGVMPLFLLLSVIVAVVMIFILLWMSLKILWTLVKAFGYILFLTIILPLQVTLGVVVPGIGIGTWIRQFAANLAVFPVTGVLFALSFIFLEQARKTVENFVSIGFSSSNPFSNVSAAQYTPGWPPLLGTGVGTTALVFLVMSFFIITLVPKAAEVASGLFTGKFAFGNAIGEAVGTPLGLATGAYNAYRAPQRAAFEQQIKSELEGGEGLTPGRQRQLRVSQAAQQIQSVAGKIFKS